MLQKLSGDYKLIGNNKFLGRFNKEEIHDITSEKVSKIYKVNNSMIDIQLMDAQFGYLSDKKILLDEVIVNNMFNDLVKCFTDNNSKYNKVPVKVKIYHKDMDKDNIKSVEKKENGSIINAYKPRWTFDDVYLNKDAKENILTSLSIAKFHDVLFNKWKLKGNKSNGRAICLNFYGKPGTGKSMAAEAIANYLKKQLLVVNYAELESKYVGETPKNIRNVFKKAKDTDSVIVFDEADSFLGKRLTNVTQSADYGVNITRSVMLIELENFEGVVIFTTNLLNNYDEAFKRRILASIEFLMPDEKGRQKIWHTHLPPEMPLATDVNEKILAEKYDNVSGADIQDIVLIAATEALRNNRKLVKIEDFDCGYSIVANRYKESSINKRNFNVIHEKVSKEQYEKEINNNC